MRRRYNHSQQTRSEKEKKIDEFPIDVSLDVSINQCLKLSTTIDSL